MPDARTRTKREGAATVEFAIVVPVFLLMVLGMIEVGRGVSVNHSLLNAARSGCRVAIIEGATQSQVESRVADGLADTGIEDYAVTILPESFSQAEPGDPVTVVVSATYDNVSWVPVPKFLGGKTITGSCTFPKE